MSSTEHLRASQQQRWDNAHLLLTHELYVDLRQIRQELHGVGAVKWTVDVFDALYARSPPCTAVAR